MARLTYGGLTRPLLQPFRQPHELLHVATEALEVLRIAFEKPLLPTRLCLPADYVNGKLKEWNQKYTNDYGNPWTSRWRVDYFGRIAQILINSGSSLLLHSGGYTANGQVLTLRDHVDQGGNWVHDKEAHKYSYEFYLDNDLEETDPIEVYDDDETFWTAGGEGSGSVGSTVSEETTIKTKGTSSLKVLIGAGSSLHAGAYHIYGSGQDWSSTEFVCIYWYGENNGRSIRWHMWSGSNQIWKDVFIDNFTGWKRFVVPLCSGWNENGSMDMSNVTKTSFEIRNTQSGDVGYLDRSVVDVGQWVKVESYVPDVLDTSIRNIKIYSWSGAAYDTPWAEFDAEDDNPVRSTNIEKLHFLDGSTLNDIYGSGQYGGYYKGERDDTKNKVFGPASIPTIIYSSYYGCLKRISFAIKMPPDDGQDSSTDGISQCKIKLEVYYADSGDPGGVQGQATYEFKPDDADQYYGLDNLDESWMALFDSALRRAWYIVLDLEPEGLKVCADEDEHIHWVEVTLQAGCRVHAGEMYFDNQSRDSDSDGAPDFLQTIIPNLSKGVPSWL